MGYVYKYTHKITEKWYIGSHNGLKKNYSGSGLLWQKAKRKYGIDTYDREILYDGPDFHAEEERILKELDATNDPMSYNMKNESLGGSFPGEKNGMFGKKLTEEHRYACGKAFRGKKRPDHSKNMIGEGNPMFGKNDHAHGIIERAKANSGKTYEEIFGQDKSKELKEKLSNSLKGKKHKLKEVECPNCKKKGAGPNMTRYHFDNCKANP